MIFLSDLCVKSKVEWLFGTTIVCHFPLSLFFFFKKLFQFSLHVLILLIKLYFEKKMGL